MVITRGRPQANKLHRASAFFENTVCLLTITTWKYTASNVVHRKEHKLEVVVMKDCISHTVWKGPQLEVLPFDGFVSKCARKLMAAIK